MQIHTITRPEIAHTCADEIVIITTPPTPVTEIAQNYKGYDVQCLTSSCLENLKCAS